MEFQILAVLEIAAVIASQNGGVVRPVDVENHISECNGNISSYRVRKTFKAMRQMDIVYFDGNQYVWCAENYLGFAMTDASSAANNAKL